MEEWEKPLWEETDRDGCDDAGWSDARNVRGNGKFAAFQVQDPRIADIG